MKALAVTCLTLGLLLGSASTASAADPVPAAPANAAAVRAFKPVALCLNESTGSFHHRTRPGHCDFYDGEAPGTRVLPAAGFPTRDVTWSHWGHSTAVGRGEYRISGRWLPVRLRLRRAVDACGRQVFTRLQMNIRICPGNWTGWDRAITIRKCSTL